MLNPIIIAFSMYSRIPMPKTAWDEKSMKYAICYFPLIGLVIGATVYTVSFLLSQIGAGSTLVGCVLTVLPIIITGGIHMDGFIDTSDALSSNQDKQKRLEIMKDPHIGAFAVIRSAVYFIMSVGLYSELDAGALKIFCIGFILSRTLSGISVITFSKAKNTGLAVLWSGMTDKKIAFAVLAAEAAICCAAMILLDFCIGIIMLIFTAIIYFYHYRNCTKNFGGITGDLAGYFLQLAEIFMLAAAVIGGKI